MDSAALFQSALCKQAKSSYRTAWHQNGKTVRSQTFQNQIQFQDFLVRFLLPAIKRKTNRPLIKAIPAHCIILVSCAVLGFKREIVRSWAVVSYRFVKVVVTVLVVVVVVVVVVVLFPGGFVSGLSGKFGLSGGVPGLSGLSGVGCLIKSAFGKA